VTEKTPTKTPTDRADGGGVPRREPEAASGVSPIVPKGRSVSVPGFRAHSGPDLATPMGLRLPDPALAPGRDPGLGRHHQPGTGGCGSAVVRTGVQVTPSAGPVVGLLLPVQDPARLARLAVEIAPGSWPWPIRWADVVAGHQVAWCGNRRKVHDLPANTSARALAAGLGVLDSAEPSRFNGNLLIAGIYDDTRVGDVPDVVVRAARRSGLLGRSATAPTPLGVGAVGAGTMWTEWA
jgi:hypothetical protein